MSLKHLEIKISGQVQDVSFRLQAQKMAHLLGVNGTVQNLPDGTVLIHAEGEEENLTQFLEWCSQGPDRARVNKVDYKTIEPENFHSFEVIT